MAQRIEVFYKFQDTRAQVLEKKFTQDGFKINNIILIDVYTLDFSLSAQQLQKCAQMLINPVVQNYNLNTFHYPQQFDWAVEIGFLPGVTDNLAKTAQESFQDLLGEELTDSDQVFTSQIIYLQGESDKEEITNLVNSLYNPVIQRLSIKNYEQFIQDEGMDIILPKVELVANPQASPINLDINDEELEKLGKEGILNTDGTRRGPLALNLTYLKTIRNYFDKLGRDPTDIELESLAQTWSEHCKHTIFNDPIDKIKDGLFNTYIKRATDEIRQKKGKKDFCVSVFRDNSGAIKFDNDFLITDKVETHNSPSALDPFGGAITGIVGVNRDTLGFGLGAKPIINRFGYCFGDPDKNEPLYRDSEKTQTLLSSRRILNGVVKGVNVGGNCSGIPTPQGFAIFDPSFRGKPLVFVGTIGLIPTKYAKKQAQNNDLIVVIGGRVGKDGIHGATFSSERLNQGSPSTAVQIGDPITQKKLSDALIKEARDLELYHSITDNGAGGLSCSVAEMAKESGGCEVNLEKVPLKYPGLYPWEIWISESQERMTLAVPKNKWEEFEKLMRQRGVEATVIGKFTNSGKCVVKFDDQIITNIDLDFLHNGLPKIPKKTVKKTTKFPEPKINSNINLQKVLLEMLINPNIAGKEFLFLQYDHEVQAGSVIKPLQGRGRVLGDASVVRPKLNSLKGVVFSQGLLPWYSQIDSYSMAAASLDLAVRHAVCVGADINNMALLDNFCWCSSNDPERLYQLEQAAKACYDLSTFYQTPFISGKDSMFNDFSGFDQKGKPVHISILPTLLISAIAIIPDVYKTLTLDPKKPGDLVYILGQTYPEMGASELYSHLGYIGNQVPQVRKHENKQLYQDFYQLVGKDIISSAISIGRGGLAIALAKMAIAGKLGLDIDLSLKETNCQYFWQSLFSESQGRIIVTLDPKNKKDFEKIMGNVFLVGKVTNKKDLNINIGKKSLSLKLEELEENYKKTFLNF